MTNKHANCLVCGSERINPLAGYYDTKGLVRCDSCGFVFMELMPTIKELDDHYRTYAYSTEGFLSPITIKRYQELLDEFEPYRKHGRLLDVGCGRGWFLVEARKRGWQVYGTEYSPTAIEIGTRNGITMHQGGLTESTFAGLEFDVITSFEVIEHINNPLDDLRNINRLIRPGGLHYCTTPNFNSLLRYHLKDRYNIITYPEHLSYYTRSTLSLVMEKAGFRKLRVQTTGISLSRLKMSKGDQREQLIAPTSADEQLRNEIESKWYLGLAKRLINFALTVTGLGMSLKGYYLKSE